MPDFFVLSVQYNGDHTHIEKLKVRRELVVDGKVQLGPVRIVPRAFVADLINSGKVTFITRVKGGDNLMYKGADIHVIENEFLSTDRNSRTRDNLENLPEF